MENKEQEIVEAVAERLQGKKQYEVYSRETVYYARTVWATSPEEAENICHEECDYGDAVDYGNWQLDDVREA